MKYGIILTLSLLILTSSSLASNNNDYGFLGPSLGFETDEGLYRNIDVPFLGILAFYETKISSNETFGSIWNIEHARPRARGEDSGKLLDAHLTYFTGSFSYGRVGKNNSVRLGIGLTYVSEKNWEEILGNDFLYSKKLLPTIQMQWTFIPSSKKLNSLASTFSVVWRRNMGIMFSISPGIFCRDLGWD